MTAGVDDSTAWESFIETTLDGYLRTMESEPVAARAFLVEMDSAGERARARRREAAHGFAQLLALKHAAIRRLDPGLGELPDRVYLGLVLGIRELVHQRFQEEPEPRLTDLAPDIITWITAMVEGADATVVRRPS